MSTVADPARVVACEIVHAVLTRDYFSNEAIDENAEMRRLTSEERAFATALIYGTLNYRIAIDHIIEQQSSRELAKIEPMVLTILRLGTWQLCYSYAVPAFAAVDESVKLCHHFKKTHSASFVNAILRNLKPEEISWRTKDRGIELGLGNELFGLLKKWFGEDDASKIGEYFLRSDFDVHIRVNRKRTTSEELQKCLKDEGVQVQPGQYFSHALHLQIGEKRIDELAPFQNGEFMVQEEAPQAVGEVAQAENATTIIDLCAAPGGKSCDLAERMPDTAKLLALDISERRLKLAKHNASRLGLNLDFAIHDASSTENLDLLKRQFPYIYEGADVVLLDVPCSGLGLLARKPELRWKMRYEDIMRFPPLQRKMLKNAVSLVKVGGELIYSTCTLNPEENQELIAQFLESDEGRGFKLQNIRSRIPHSLQSCLGSKQYTVNLLDRGYLLFRPDVTGGDGFFIAVLKNEGER